MSLDVASNFQGEHIVALSDEEELALWSSSDDSDVQLDFADDFDFLENEEALLEARVISVQTFHVETCRKRSVADVDSEALSTKRRREQEPTEVDHLAQVDAEISNDHAKEVVEQVSNGEGVVSEESQSPHPSRGYESSQQDVTAQSTDEQESSNGVVDSSDAETVESVADDRVEHEEEQISAETSPLPSDDVEVDEAERRWNEALGSLAMSTWGAVRHWKVDTIDSDQIYWRPHIQSRQYLLEKRRCCQEYISQTHSMLGRLLSERRDPADPCCHGRSTQLLQSVDMRRAVLSERSQRYVEAIPDDSFPACDRSGWTDLYYLVNNTFVEARAQEGGRMDVVINMISKRGQHFRLYDGLDRSGSAEATDVRVGCADAPRYVLYVEDSRGDWPLLSVTDGEAVVEEDHVARFIGLIGTTSLGPDLMISYLWHHVITPHPTIRDLTVHGVGPMW